MKEATAVPFYVCSCSFRTTLRFFFNPILRNFIDRWACRGIGRSSQWGSVIDGRLHWSTKGSLVTLEVRQKRGQKHVWLRTYWWWLWDGYTSILLIAHVLYAMSITLIMNDAMQWQIVRDGVRDIVSAIDYYWRLSGIGLVVHFVQERDSATECTWKLSTTGIAHLADTCGNHYVWECTIYEIWCFCLSWMPIWGPRSISSFF